MKMILICPSERSEMDQLTGTLPLAALPLFGETPLELWLRHLAANGFKQVKILAADRQEEIRRVAGSGEKWGIEATVHAEAIEPTPAEARRKHKPASESGYLPEPGDVQVVDHLPWDDSYPMFADYAGWFAACRKILERAQPGFRVGMRERTPGVWVGRDCQVAPNAKLTAPCWLGRGVHVGAHASIGPNVIVEDETFIDERAELEDAWVGPQTFVGALTRISESLAWGSGLINWRTGSHIVVPDAYLLSSVDPAGRAVKGWLSGKRIPAIFQGSMARPIAAWASLKAKLPG